jgi:hypothetical protein
LFGTVFPSKIERCSLAIALLVLVPEVVLEYYSASLSLFGWMFLALSLMTLLAVHTLMEFYGAFRLCQEHRQRKRQQRENEVQQP